jgi:hypothetical protein
MGALLFGCDGRRTQDAHVTTAQVATQSIPVTGAVATRLSLAEATAAVREEIFRSKPGMNPSCVFPLKELTTTEVWDRLHIQVFAVTDGIYMDQDFIIHQRKVSPLGIGLGGYGVMSMCVADLADDGHAELVFTYSWGSGIHRSLVGIWTGGESWIDAKPALGDYDLWLEKIDDHHVRVAFGQFDPFSGKFHRFGDFGTVRLTGEAASGHLEIILSQELPDQILNRVWR